MDRRKLTLTQILGAVGLWHPKAYVYLERARRVRHSHNYYFCYKNPYL